ncbi:MAG TPA: PilX N-terminal domain-containing pilus assembly protein, partial [Candidatus Acidoferrales bacterium]
MKNTNRTNQNIDVLSRHSGREQGMALVTTLLLLTLLSAVTVGMVLAASSDELINGYYRNMRGSFYAADSGLNIVRQAMLNQIAAAVPANVTNPAVQPIPSGTDATVQSSILSTYGSNASLNSGQAANSWPESYRITEASLSLPPVGGCTVSGTYWSGTCAAPILNDMDDDGNADDCSLQPVAPVNLQEECNNSRPTYTYNYTYSLKAVGLTHASEETTLTDRGNMMVTVNLTPTGPQTTSFAAWGMFIDQYAICSGSYLVPGTITGPVFTNGAWTFGTAGAYIFTDPVGSVNANLGYQFPGGLSKCKQSPIDPYTLGNQTINPDFQGGYQLDQPHVDLPQNDFSQKQAVLDGIGTDASPVTSPEMNAVLKDISATAYPSSGASSGVYLPYTTTASTNCPTPPCMTGGGVY